MMRALQARGHALFAFEQADIFWNGDGTQPPARPLTVGADDHDWYRAGEPLVRPLASFSAVLMRKDPPFDMEYVYSTYLLEAAEARGRARLQPAAGDARLQREDGDREVPGVHRRRRSSRRDAELIREFIDEHADVILKPLDGMGGTSVFRVREDDPNRNVIIETVGHHGAQSVMAQRFIPEIVDGDKRILLIAGEPVPHSLARIPKPGETRGNLAAGGRGVARPLSTRDREIAEGVGAKTRAGRPAAGRARRHRRLPHRDQRHQPDLLRRDHAADRVRRRRPIPTRWNRRSASRPRETMPLRAC